MPDQKNSWSIFAYFLCCSLLIGAAFSYPKWTKEYTEATLSWDVMGFYLYLPATFIYKDLKQLKFKDEILKKYRPTGSFYQAFQHTNGNFVMKYPIGLAILFSPFFALASLIAWLSGYPIDGFSFPYQLAISWGGLFMAFLGLWMSRKNLLHYFSDQVTAITLILLAFGTNYLNYSGIGGAHTHNWLFTIYALLIHFSIRWHRKPSYLDSIAIGVCVGLAALTRPTDIISFLIPLLWGFTTYADDSSSSRINGNAVLAAGREWLKTIQIHWKKLALTTIVIALLGSIQLIYWKYVGGDWIVYSYQDQGFSWDGRHLSNTFFSYRKGWLVYTPMMSLALIGFYFLYRKSKTLFWPVFIFCLVNIYIAFSWDIWWYGGSFGQRAMVQGYAVLIFALAAFIEFMTFVKWRALLLVGLCTFFIWLNILQTYQAHFNGILDPEYMTKAYYWRIFGKTKIKALDKKLLDTDEDFINERKNIQQIYFNDFESGIDSNLVQLTPREPKSLAVFLNKQNQFTPAQVISRSASRTEARGMGDTNKMELESRKWLRVQARFFAPQKEWDTWRMAQLITSFQKGDQKVKERAIRIHRFVKSKEWTEIWMDIQIPDEDFETVKIYCWNANGDKPLYMDDLVVELFEE